MNVGQESIREILEAKLGTEKTSIVLNNVSQSYMNGRSEKGLQQHFEDALKNAGCDDSIRFIKKSLEETACCATLRHL